MVCCFENIDIGGLPVIFMIFQFNLKNIFVLFSINLLETSLQSFELFLYMFMVAQNVIGIPYLNKYYQIWREIIPRDGNPVPSKSHSVPCPAGWDVPCRDDSKIIFDVNMYVYIHILKKKIEVHMGTKITTLAVYN